MHAAGESLRRPRTALLVVTALVAVALLVLAGESHAAATPSCPAGQAPRTIERRTSCAAAGQIIGPIRAGRPSLGGALLTQSATNVVPRRSGQRRLARLLAADQRLQRLAPRAARQLGQLVGAALARAPQPASPATRAMTHGMDGPDNRSSTPPGRADDIAAAARSRRAPAPAPGPTITVTPSERGGSVRATQQVGRANLDVQIGVQAPEAGQIGSGQTTGEVTLETNADSGAKARVTTASSSSEQAEECPSALGTVLASSTSKLRRTVTVQAPGKGSVASTTRVSTDVRATARVGNDARLDYADVTVRRTSEVASRGLIYQQEQRTSVRIGLRGASPAASPTSGETEVRIRSAAAISGQAGIERELATEADAGRAASAADDAARIVDVLRKAEAHWRTPNACAKLTLEPTSPKEGLAPREQVPVRGRLTAADGDQVAAGTVEARGLIGTVDPAQRSTDGVAPTEFTATANDEQVGSSILLVNFTATSRAGIAEATFEGRLGIPNRWTGPFTDTFTDDDGLTYARSGTVTFVRDDAAVRAAGYPLDGQAGYRVEQVTYRSTITGTDLAGCSWNVDATSTQTATSVQRSALTLELQPDANNARAYSLVTSWNGGQQPFGILCPPPTGTVQVSITPDAALTVAPGPRPRTIGLSGIDGSYTDAGFGAGGRAYAWQLKPAP